ncbi:hypothetical protein [Prosthecobacter sp.]|uniref:hypothetical protein n=1 Tax=Prosthecobacter sp. TaxID=1965333 RepID=UPI002488072A|nr:hypothetical protein [Prosthecobacter sp.]MDI1312584.1 hypothetical protein [Prosthecobacter sp.]
MMLLIVIIVLMMGIALAAYLFGRRYRTSRVSRGSAPCREPNELYGDGRSEEFHGLESGDFDDAGNAD